MNTIGKMQGDYVKSMVLFYLIYAVGFMLAVVGAMSWSHLSWISYGMILFWHVCIWLVLVIDWVTWEPEYTENDLMDGIYRWMMAHACLIVLSVPYFTLG